MAKKNPLAVTQINPAMLTTINEADFGDWSKDQYISAGEEASKIKYFSQWVLGKLVSAYSSKYGDIADFARSIHMEVNSLYAYKSVYETITRSKPDYVPDGHLTWGALLLIAKSEDPKNVIKAIEKMSGDGKVSMNDVHRTIKEKERKDKGDNRRLPSKPKVKFTINEELNKWEMTIGLDDMDKINWQGEWGKIFYKFLKKIWEK